MTVKMVVLWVCLVLFVASSQAAGEFDVIHSPQSLKFSGSSRTRESLLKEIFSASLGLSVEEDAEWDGLSIVDPFTTPEAVVEIYVDGVSSLGNTAGLKPHTYPLNVDEYEPDTFGAIQHRIKQRFNGDANKLVKFRLSDPNEFSKYADVFGQIKVPKVTKKTYEHLNPSVEEDYQFLSEIEALKAITTQVRSGIIAADNIIDFYNFRFQSLHVLSDFHGASSLQVKEAKKILGDAIHDLSDAFVKAYDGSVLVSVVCTDVAHTRRVRAAPNPNETQRQMKEQKRHKRVPPITEGNNTSSSNDSSSNSNESSSSSTTTTTTTERSTPIDLEQKDSYPEEYSAIFNIILWFGVVFVFALISIVYALIDMDPGRDSIIYRMTSTRMKKDN